jgi:NADH-quinone oxidoreductase subunit N
MSLSSIFPILPEILLLILGMIVLVLDLVIPKERDRSLGWITAVGMGLIILISLTARPGEQGVLVWGGMISFDWLSYTFKMLFIFGAGITALLAMDFNELGSRGEFYLLMIASTIGMSFMASAADLVMLYLSIETVSIPLYILAGFFVRDTKSTESGFKYLLFGAMTSAIMLYGFSLLYGLSGTTNLLNIVSAIMQGSREGLAPIYIGSLFMVLVGLGFKISAVPFHFWAPDVYEGAPTPVAGFLSTASKAAGFVVLVRVLLFVFPTDLWAPIVAALSVVTMTLGNLVALTQHNIKRLLAYSSIAHAGYALIGVVTVSSLGLVSVVYYLFAYLVTNLAAFGIVSAYGRVTGSDELTAYHGMSRRSPGLALALMVAFLSLAGMPPFAGFVAKVFIFMSAVQNPRWIWLAVVGVLNSIVGLYYYLTVLKYVYLYRSDEDEKPVPVTRSFKVAIVILVAGILLVGTMFGPWFDWAATAAAAMF